MMLDFKPPHRENARQRIQKQTEQFWYAIYFHLDGLQFHNFTRLES